MDTLGLLFYDFQYEPLETCHFCQSVNTFLTFLTESGIP